MPSRAADGTISRKQRTVTIVPAKIPANWARNCLRGFAPSRYPLLRSVRRSAADAAAPAVMLALMRLTFMFPGLRPPKISCVTLPIAPIGVVSVSPVIRQATRAKANVSTTATALCQRGMPKLNLASVARPTRPTSWPPRNQEAGTSMASISLALCLFSPEKSAPKLPNARSALRHLKPIARKLDVIMQETPPQTVHITTSLYAVSVMMPLYCKIGTYTTQHRVPPSSMLAEARIPVSAPAAMKTGSQSNKTTRSIQALPSTASLSRVSSASMEKGARLAWTSLNPSFQNWLMAARTPKMPSARAAHALLAVRVQCPQRFRRGNPAGETKLLDIDHLAFHGNRHCHTEDRDKEDPAQRQRDRQGIGVQEHVCRECRDQRPARRVAGRTGRGLHAVVLQDGHRRLHQADAKSACQRA